MILLWGCAVNPVTGRQELSLMGEAQEIQMGAEAYPLYTQMSEGLFPDPEHVFVVEQRNKVVSGDDRTSQIIGRSRYA